ILLIYAQKQYEYRRELNKSTPVNETAATSFVLTRAGTMKHIVKDGNKYYFDFQVEAYPDNSKVAEINEILQPSIAASQNTWNKWVTISESYEPYQALLAGTDEDNWRRIVEMIGRPPMQFANDAFWRLKGMSRQSGQSIEPTIRRIKQAGELRRVATE